MKKSYSAFGLINVLTSGTARFDSFDLKIVFVDLDLYVLSLGKHCNGCCACLYSALRFCFGHALNSVNAAFKFKLRVGPLAVYGKGNFLKTSKLGLVAGNKLALPFNRICIHIVHSVKNSGEKRGFLTACSSAYLNDNVLAIVGILGKKQNLQSFLRGT